MEVIAAIALGLSTYYYLDSKSVENTAQTQYEETYGSPVTIQVSESNSNVQWVFIDG